MCFSPAASFALSGALIPLGLYTMAKVRTVAPEWLPFAAFPLAFGIQQMVEGLVWIAVLRENPSLTLVAGQAYLFFSHFFWPAFVPFAVRALETDAVRRRQATLLTLLGTAFGLMVYLPQLLSSDLPQIGVVQHSLDYRTTLPEGGVPDALLRAIYAGIVLGSLWLSSDPRIRLFGTFVAVSLAVTWAAFAYAFVSVWCFFAAILSVDVAVILLGRRTDAPAGIGISRARKGRSAKDKGRK